MSKTIQPGQPAPDFELQAQDGSTFRLSTLKGQKNVVLYFYPKNETTVCTKQACSFRDSYEVFKEQNAEVVGVSDDDLDSHQSFARNHRLPFVLLSDPKGKVRKQYGVTKTLGLVPARTTFIIDKNGTVQHVFSALLQAQAHVDEALAVLKRLS